MQLGFLMRYGHDISGVNVTFDLYFTFPWFNDDFQKLFLLVKPGVTIERLYILTFAGAKRPCYWRATICEIASCRGPSSSLRSRSHEIHLTLFHELDSPRSRTRPIFELARSQMRVFQENSVNTSLCHSAITSVDESERKEQCAWIGIFIKPS